MQKIKLFLLFFKNLNALKLKLFFSFSFASQQHHFVVSPQTSLLSHTISSVVFVGSLKFWFRNFVENGGFS